MAWRGAAWRAWRGAARTSLDPIPLDEVDVLVAWVLRTAARRDPVVTLSSRRHTGGRQPHGLAWHVTPLTVFDVWVVERREGAELTSRRDMVPPRWL